MQANGFRAFVLQRARTRHDNQFQIGMEFHRAIHFLNRIAMKKGRPASFLTLGLVTCVASAQPLALSEIEGRIHGVMPESHFEVLNNNCLKCHDSVEEEGGMNLEDISFTMDSIAAAESWQKVLNAVNSGEMPPKDEDQLSVVEKTEFLGDLSRQLVIARDALSDSGGVITMRRLNRREYENTIESLLGVKIDASDLPDDANPGGFDTNGSALFFSSDQFEQYLTLGRRALDLAMSTGKPRPIKKTRFEAEEIVPRELHRFTARLPKAFNPSALRDRFVAPDGLEIDYQEIGYGLKAENYRWLNHPAFFLHPDSHTGAPLFNYFYEFGLPNFNLPAQNEGQKFIFRTRIALLGENVPEHRRYIEFGPAPSGIKKGEMNVAGFRKVTGTMAEPEIIEFEFTPSDDSASIVRIRERHINSLNAAKLFFREHTQKTDRGPPATLWVDWVEWEGPFATAPPVQSNPNLFVPKAAGQSKTQHHRAILENFAKRAFRTKAPSAGFIDRLMALYEDDVADGVSPNEALKEQLSVVLASPGFLYLNEPTFGDEHRELTDQELAVRLSYFLWSAPPDETLERIAAEGKLHDASTLARQTHRLLNDPRADAFISGFTHQWLHMERLDFFQFSYEKYPRFDDSVKESARREIYETVKDTILASRPIGELLKSDHIVVNNLLAGYYGISGVDGEHFRRLPVPSHHPRGGLLGTAAVMAMGSDGERSSPVERGAWILRTLLNDAPPPAPANVPQLSRLADHMLSARDLQKLHQEEPQCAQCHRTIDPLGFGLENFNAVGHWREAEVFEQIIDDLTTGKSRKLKTPVSIPIDPSGTLPDGTPFHDWFEFRDRMAEQESAFARGFTEGLIEYALGRPFGFIDYNMADDIMARAQAQDYAMDQFILGVVLSKRFKLK